MLSSFTYSVLDSNETKIGKIEWPNISQATNARLRWNSDPAKGEVSIFHLGRRYGVQHEYLTRSWVNDTRYYLKDGDQVKATAELRCAPGFLSRSKLHLVLPFPAEFVRRRQFFKGRLELQGPSGLVGSVADRASFMTRREVIADLPDSLDVPTKMFVLFLALHRFQTQA